METQTGGNGNVVSSVVSGDGSGVSDNSNAVSDVVEEADVADVNGVGKVKIPVPWWLILIAKRKGTTVADYHDTLSQEGFTPNEIGVL